MPKKDYTKKLFNKKINKSKLTKSLAPHGDGYMKSNVTNHMYLRIGRVIDVDSDTNEIAVSWLDLAGQRDSIKITHPYCGLRGHHIAMPEKGALVVCGFITPTEVIPLTYLPGNYARMLELTLFPEQYEQVNKTMIQEVTKDSMNRDDVNLNEFSSKEILDNKIKEISERILLQFMPKYSVDMAKIGPGEHLISSAQGAEIKIDESLFLSDMLLDEIVIDARERAIILKSMQFYQSTEFGQTRQGAIIRPYKVEMPEGNKVYGDEYGKWDLKELESQKNRPLITKKILENIRTQEGDMSKNLEEALKELEDNINEDYPKTRALIDDLMDAVNIPIAHIGRAMISSEESKETDSEFIYQFKVNSQKILTENMITVNEFSDSALGSLDDRNFVLLPKRERYKIMRAQLINSTELNEKVEERVELTEVEEEVDRMIDINPFRPVENRYPTTRKVFQVNDTSEKSVKQDSNFISPDEDPAEAARRNAQRGYGGYQFRDPDSPHFDPVLGTLTDINILNRSETPLTRPIPKPIGPLARFTMGTVVDADDRIVKDSTTFQEIEMQYRTQSGALFNLDKKGNFNVNLLALLLNTDAGSFRFGPVYRNVQQYEIKDKFGFKGDKEQAQNATTDGGKQGGIQFWLPLPIPKGGLELHESKFQELSHGYKGKKAKRIDPLSNLYDNDNPAAKEVTDEIINNDHALAIISQGAYAFKESGTNKGSEKGQDTEDSWAESNRVSSEQVHSPVWDLDTGPIFYNELNIKMPEYCDGIIRNDIFDADICGYDAPQTQNVDLYSFQINLRRDQQRVKSIIDKITSPSLPPLLEFTAGTEVDQDGKVNKDPYYNQEICWNVTVNNKALEPTEEAVANIQHNWPRKQPKRTRINIDKFGNFHSLFTKALERQSGIWEEKGLAENIIDKDGRKAIIYAKEVSNKFEISNYDPATAEALTSGTDSNSRNLLAHLPRLNKEGGKRIEGVPEQIKTWKEESKQPIFLQNLRESTIAGIPALLDENINSIQKRINLNATNLIPLLSDVPDGFIPVPADAISNKFEFQALYKFLTELIKIEYEITKLVQSLKAKDKVQTKKHRQKKDAWAIRERIKHLLDQKHYTLAKISNIGSEIKHDIGLALKGEKSEFSHLERSIWNQHPFLQDENINLKNYPDIRTAEQAITDTVNNALETLRNTPLDQLKKVYAEQLTEIRDEIIAVENFYYSVYRRIDVMGNKEENWFGERKRNVTSDERSTIVLRPKELITSDPKKPLLNWQWNVITTNGEEFEPDVSAEEDVPGTIPDKIYYTESVKNVFEYSDNQVYKEGTERLVDLPEIDKNDVTVIFPVPEDVEQAELADFKDKNQDGQSKENIVTHVKIWNEENEQTLEQEEIKDIYPLRPIENRYPSFSEVATDPISPLFRHFEGTLIDNDDRLILDPTTFQPIKHQFRANNGLFFNIDQFGAVNINIQSLFFNTSGMALRNGLAFRAIKEVLVTEKQLLEPTRKIYTPRLLLATEKSKGVMFGIAKDREPAAPQTWEDTKRFGLGQIPSPEISRDTSYLNEFKLAVAETMRPGIRNDVVDPDILGNSDPDFDNPRTKEVDLYSFQIDFKRDFGDAANPNSFVRDNPIIELSAGNVIDKKGTVLYDVNTAWPLALELTNNSEGGGEQPATILWDKKKNLSLNNANNYISSSAGFIDFGMAYKVDDSTEQIQSLEDEGIEIPKNRDKYAKTVFDSLTQFTLQVKQTGNEEVRNNGFSPLKNTGTSTQAPSTNLNLGTDLEIEISAGSVVDDNHTNSVAKAESPILEKDVSFRIKQRDNLTVITISKDGDIEIKCGAKIEIQAANDITIKGDKNINIEATDTLTLKGSTVDINP